MPRELKTVVVFGATGSVGSALIEIIAKHHHDCDILAVSRSGKVTDRLAFLSTVKMVEGDIETIGSVLELTSKPQVDTVYCCVGFGQQYERKYWADHWPVVVDNLLTASRENPHQKYVFCDSLYAYGPNTNISTITETVPPSTKSKPAIRAMIRQTMAAYMKEAPERFVAVGASGFYGPHVTASSMLGDTMTGALVKGQNPLAIGSADKIHDFCFVPDFARALYLVSVSDNAETFGRFWIAPHSIHGKTLREIAADIGTKVGTSKSIIVIGGWLVSIMGLFVTIMSEMKEMLPFWTNDYTVDDSEFTKVFGMKATPYDDSLQALVNSYKEASAK